LKEFLRGRTGLEALKHLCFSPTCTLNGFNTGYSGPGLKAVLPHEAMAKVSFRLVEAQRPDNLLQKLKRHLLKHGFGDIEVVVLQEGYEPCKTSANDPFVKYVAKKLEEVYGMAPAVWPTNAGTSPIYTIKNWMGTPVVSGGGVGYPGSDVHAPNENIQIGDYVRSIKFVASLITSFR